MQDRIQSPQVAVTHDLTEVLFGGQERRRHPAFHHAAIAPTADPARPHTHARVRTFDDVGAGQAAVQRGRHVEPIQGETFLQSLAQAGCRGRIIAFGCPAMALTRRA